MASSASVGLRPRMLPIRANSASVSPSAANGCGRPGVADARSTVSSGATVISGVLMRLRSSDRDRLQDRGEEAEAVGGRPGEHVDGVLRMRHEPGYIAGLADNASDVSNRSVRVAIDVPGQDLTA